ncbi:MAG: DivIVA domain-containing protein [Clostridia bacterium]|nr:DivIVA domain-containing protein [Clostridia bacterium]
MAKFNIDKKGYNTEEVDEYINKMYLKYEDKLSEQKDRVVALKGEVDSLNEKLSKYVNKDEQISKALIYAVEKAEQIETNAKNVYNLEIKRINALYSRWEELLLEVEKHCPQVNKNGYINSLMEDFRESVAEVSKTGLTLNTKNIKDELKRNSDDFIRNILNKMDYVVNSKPIAIAETKPKAKKEKVEPASVKPEPTKEVKKAEKVAVKLPIKPAKAETLNAEQPEIKKAPEAKSYSTISSINERLKHLNLISKVPTKTPNVVKHQSLAEKYLNSDDDLEQNAYSKNFTKKKLEKGKSPFNYMEYPEPNESGFDLKDALNPKEDLDEIMKAFDFFGEE